MQFNCQHCGERVRMLEDGTIGCPKGCQYPIPTYVLPSQGIGLGNIDQICELLRNHRTIIVTTPEHGDPRVTDVISELLRGILAAPKVGQ